MPLFVVYSTLVDYFKFFFLSEGYFFFAKDDFIPWLLSPFPRVWSLVLDYYTRVDNSLSVLAIYVFTNIMVCYRSQFNNKIPLSLSVFDKCSLKDPLQYNKLHCISNVLEKTFSFASTVV